MNCCLQDIEDAEEKIGSPDSSSPDSSSATPAQAINDPILHKALTEVLQFI